MAVLHVVPNDRKATWRVHDGETAAAQSEHTNASAAESAAESEALRRDEVDEIVVHDRYHRTCSVRPADRRSGGLPHGGPERAYSPAGPGR